MRILDRINRTGTTVVMATHDHAIVDAMQRRVVELDRGHVTRDDSRGIYESSAEPAKEETPAPAVIDGSAPVPDQGEQDEVRDTGSLAADQSEVTAVSPSTSGDSEAQDPSGEAVTT